MESNIGLQDNSQWKKGRLAYEIAKLMADNDRMYEDELVQTVMKVRPGDVDYQEAIKIVRRAIEKLREGTKNDPDVMLIYADFESVETDKVDPLTKKKHTYKRKFYFNAKIYEDLEKKIDQMIATGHGFIRRALRNEDILKTLGWDKRKIDLLKVMSTYEEARERFKPIVNKTLEVRAEEILSVAGCGASMRLPDNYDEDGRWICPVCDGRIPAHKRTKHALTHKKQDALEQADIERINAREELDRDADRLYNSFAALTEEDREDTVA